MQLWDPLYTYSIPHIHNLRSYCFAHFTPAPPVFQPAHSCEGSNPSESHPPSFFSLYPDPPTALRCFHPGPVLSCPDPGTAAPCTGHALPACKCLLEQWSQHFTQVGPQEMPRSITTPEACSWTQIKCRILSQILCAPRVV